MEDKKIRNNLIKWYHKHQRELPWRESNDPYAIWISEAMLQQTQVSTVIPYFKKFLRQFPDIHALAQANLESVLKIWEGMGYYARARNLHRAAALIVKRYQGKIPSSVEELKTLPGVGDYIASAVSSIAFQNPCPVVDGNVKRVLSRIFLIDTPVNDSSSHKVFYPVALRFVDIHSQNHQGIFNQAIMELGALICRPRKPDCTKCPVLSFCQAYKQGLIHQFPRRHKKQKTPEYLVSAAILRKNGKILITRRKLEGHLGGLWEFPGGKVLENETPQQACIREIKEEVNLDISVDKLLTRIKHAYTHFKIKMDIFNCTYISGELKLNGPMDYRWVKAHELALFPFPGADRKFMHLIIEND